MFSLEYFTPEAFIMHSIPLQSNTGLQGDSAVHCKALATAVSYCIYTSIASGNLQMVTGEKFPFFFAGFSSCLEPHSDSFAAGKTED